MEILRSNLFSRYPRIVFGMSTKNGGVSSPPYGLNLSVSVGDNPENVRENRKRFFHALNIDTSRLAFPLQVHSSHIQYAPRSGRYPDTDGLTTDRTETYLIVTVADCLPVFLFDPVHSAIAGIHAGWRGTGQSIAKKAVRFMNERWQTDPADIIAYLGPSAGVCCYEVGEEVAEFFPEEFSVSKPNGRFHIDIAAVNKVQLQSEGVQVKNIEHENGCTICMQDRFHSYRRDGTRSGRMMGVIGMKT
jgi:polyphenol oxidase